MPNYTPDLTGLDWDHHVTTYQRTVFRPNQKLLFDIPIFSNERLEVILLGGIPLPLIRDLEWAVLPDDIDYDAMSVCKEIDPEFSGTLLKSLTITRSFSDNYSVQVKFNQLFADYVNYARINQNQTLEVTPTLIGNMLEQLTYLQQMVLNPSGLYSPQSSTVKLLDEDISGNVPGHLIEDELHDIDTINGLRLIRPLYGAFFGDSVIVKNALSDEVFGTNDFMIIEVDLAKTRRTGNESGVYQTISITKPFVGSVKVTYQAFGGVTDVGSVRKLHDRLWAIEDYLSNTAHITPRTLPADPAIIVLRNKIQEMEGKMRLLLQNGLPSYGDVSTGTAVIKRISALDQLAHWWSIATLYRVEGSTDNILSDVFKFRLKSLISGLMFECAVSVNVNPGASQRIQITCSNSNIPEDTLSKYSPRFRILEVASGGIYSGVVLQIGMRLPNILQETFDIEDMSGRESCWKLIPFDANSTPAEDSSVLMPNGTSVWAGDDIHSMSDVASIPFVGGLNVTSASLNQAVTINGANTISDMVIQNVGDIDMRLVRALKLNIVVNIVDPDPQVVMVNVPIESWDMTGKRYDGAGSFMIGSTKYVIDIQLRYDAFTELYAITWKFTRESGTDTLNITNVRLIF